MSSCGTGDGLVLPLQLNAENRPPAVDSIYLLRKIRLSLARPVGSAAVGRYQEDHSMPTLKLTVAERDWLDKRTRNRIKVAEEGDDLNDAQPVLNFNFYVELS
jgi:hypothetical protein